MRDIPAGSVDLTVTSPPYDNLRTYNGNNAQWGEHVWKAVIADLHRVTAEGGVVVWVVGDATIKGSETGTSFKQALWSMECGFRLHDTMIYAKPNFSAVGALKTRYAPVFEYMFVFSKGTPRSFNPLKDRPCKTSGKAKSGTIRQRDGTTKRMSNEGWIQPAFGQRYNIWEIAPQSRAGHPAPFPESLARDHIKSWSNVGDTILDPFMGSGTTGAAAKNLGRSFIGIEMDADYFAAASKRIDETLEPIGDLLDV
jgi:DNA modification methylase